MTDLDDIIARDPHGGRPTDVDDALARLTRAHRMALEQGEGKRAAELERLAVGLMQTFDRASNGMRRALELGHQVEQVTEIGQWSSLARLVGDQGRELVKASEHLHGLARRLAEVKRVLGDGP